MSAWLIGTSLAANPVSAISLVSAPTFEALRPEGGLRWLQYEFALPLAMESMLWWPIPRFSVIKDNKTSLRLGVFARGFWVSGIRFRISPAKGG